MSQLLISIDSDNRLHKTGMNFSKGIVVVLKGITYSAIGIGKLAVIASQELLSI